MKATDIGRSGPKTIVMNLRLAVADKMRCYQWNFKVLFLAISKKRIYFENSCITNYMPNNQFKRGELYSVINGMASTAVAKDYKRILDRQDWRSRSNNGVFCITYGKKIV